MRLQLILLQTILIPAVFSGCASRQPPLTSADQAHSASTDEESAGLKRIQGDWLLNREKTIERSYRRRGMRWDSLPEKRKEGIVASFKLDFHLILNADMTWKALYSSGKDRKSSEGTYRILKSARNEVSVEALTRSGNETVPQRLDFIFEEDEPVLLLIKSGSDAAEFIIEKK